ncbi:MAG TPA: protein kinase [Terriglobia bacterium]|nr:protein kinase [Terriglobia bacterium]
MALTSGMKLGPYEIASPLGAGGMGEVYRARDSKLNREVALKVLPAAMASDTERMARFQREAQVLASLNHPNIASIYGLEDSGSVRALVMELVEGPTLAERIAGTRPLTRPSSVGRPPQVLGPPPSPRGRGAGGEGVLPSPIPIDEALSITRQIAEALEAAHERGIIHRDLKPANIKITDEGVVKVLDFGLAKALTAEDSSSGISNSPTISIAATQAGMILGTAAYMSPEQAKGKKVDRRADIWAFGCVLFEMLAGKKTFEGETTSDVLAAVIRAEPEWNALPAETPQAIRRLLMRCLQKDPKQRLRDIGEARITIEETLRGAEAEPPLTPLLSEEGKREARGGKSWRRAANWAAAVILLCLAGIGGMWFQSRRVTPPLRWSGDLLGGSSVAFGPRVSPDGHTVAFEAMVDNLTQVAVMNPESGNWTVLTHDKGRGIIENIVWSRDGSKLYFDRAHVGFQAIYTIPPIGGEERLFLKDSCMPEVLPDGSLLVVRLDSGRKSQIAHYWPDSGRVQPMDGYIWRIPSGPLNPLRVFPDGKEAVFFGTLDGTSPSPNLYALDIASGKARPLAPQLSIPSTVIAFPMAPTLDNRSVLIDLPSGSLHQIVSLPRSGSGAVQVLMTLSTPVWFMDSEADGSIYVDQVERPLQVLRFPISGGPPEVIATSETYPPSFMQPVAFPDGGFIVPALLSGHARLLLGKPNGNFFPLLDTAEESGPPAALLPDNQVAFIAGTGLDQAIVIASTGDGRIIRRLEGSKGKGVNTLVASLDGKTLYYSADGNIWSIPAADGTPIILSAGDGVAPDPNGKDLMINLWETDGMHLFRVALSGGPRREIRIPGDIPMNNLPLSGSALGQGGKVLVGVQSKDSWFYSLAVLDVGSGRITSVPLNYTGDILLSGWTSDGRILAFGEPIRARIWRFRPVH